MTEMIVVKVGGSLFDLPDLGPRLRRWLAELAAPDVLLVPGGGVTANAIRALDECHALGEEKSHWLALRALTLNARFLADLLGLPVVGDCAARGVAILDAFAFARRDEEEHPDERLPHAWAVTSDSVAARAAVVADAAGLILLKSVTIPAGVDWEEAGRRGYVDALFGRLLRGARRPPEVRAVNLRTWTGSR